MILAAAGGVKVDLATRTMMRIGHKAKLVAALTSTYEGRRNLIVPRKTGAAPTGSRGSERSSLASARERALDRVHEDERPPVGHLRLKGGSHF